MIYSPNRAHVTSMNSITFTLYMKCIIYDKHRQVLILALQTAELSTGFSWMDGVRHEAAVYPEKDTHTRNYDNNNN